MRPSESVRNYTSTLRMYANFAARTVKKGQELFIFGGRYSDRKVRRESAALLVIGVVVPVIIGIRDRLGFNDSADLFTASFTELCVLSNSRVCMVIQQV